MANNRVQVDVLEVLKKIKPSVIIVETINGRKAILRLHLTRLFIELAKAVCPVNMNIEYKQEVKSGDE